MRGLVPAFLLMALMLIAFGPGTTLAQANSAHGFLGELGTGPGSAAGQLQLAAPFHEDSWNGPLYSPVTIAGSGVAVNDQTHDVYVADTGNHRVDEFEADGKFALAFGKDVGGPGIDTCTLIPGCGAGAEGSAPGELAAPRFVAVDNSAGPSHGDVYVGDGVGKEAQNEEQFVELNGATEGTYTLTFEGETTSPISYNSKAYDGSERARARTLRRSAKHSTH